MLNVCFRLVGGVPVIGPLFDDSETARRAAKRWLSRFNRSCSDRRNVRVFIEQDESLYSLVIMVDGRVLYRLSGLDELLVRRLYRSVSQKRMLVLTSFVNEGSVEPRPLAVTEGVGLVVFQQGEVV
jgi:hypothetical protein